MFTWTWQGTFWAVLRRTTRTSPIATNKDRGRSRTRKRDAEQPARERRARRHRGVRRLAMFGDHHHRSHHRGHGGFFDFEGPDMNLGADDELEGDFGGIDFVGDD